MDKGHAYRIGLGASLTGPSASGRRAQSRTTSTLERPDPRTLGKCRVGNARLDPGGPAAAHDDFGLE